MPLTANDKLLNERGIRVLYAWNLKTKPQLSQRQDLLHLAIRAVGVATGCVDTIEEALHGSFEALWQGIEDASDVVDLPTRRKGDGGSTCKVGVGLERVTAW